MTKIKEIKKEIKSVENVFTLKDERFQTLNTSVDELAFDFIKNEIHHRIRASFPENYPESAPVWFADSDDTGMTDVLTKLNNANGPDCRLVKQVVILVSELCQLHELPLPSRLNELKMLNPPTLSDNESMDGNDQSDSEDSSLIMTDDEEEEEIEEEEEEEEEEDVKIVNDLDNTDHEDYCDDDVTDDDVESDGCYEIIEIDDFHDIDDEHVPLLKRLERIQKEIKSKGSASIAISATRLFRELCDIFRSTAFKNQEYSVALLDDSIYNWNIKLRSVDSESPLYSDLIVLNQKEGTDGILLNVKFTETYPFEAPFVRVIQPQLTGGYMRHGGFIGATMLSAQDWSSAYTVEMMIKEIRSLLAQGKTRVMFKINPCKAAPLGYYTLGKTEWKNTSFDPPSKQRLN